MNSGVRKSGAEVGGKRGFSCREPRGATAAHLLTMKRTRGGKVTEKSTRTVEHCYRSSPPPPLGTGKKERIGSILKLSSHLVKTASEGFSYSSSPPLPPFPSLLLPIKRKEEIRRKEMRNQVNI
jgi:hypothetical protein